MIPGPKLAADSPPVERARDLITATYFVEEATITRTGKAADQRGGFSLVTIAEFQVMCHVTRVANQRGAFTQGSTSMAGHGPLTSAAAWFLHVPIGTQLQVTDQVTLRSSTKLSIVSADDESSWEVMETYRAVELGINQ